MRTCIRWILFVAAITGMTNGVRAQDTPQVVEVPVEATVTPLEIGLRPNTPIRLGFELRNPGKDTLRDVTVRVVHTIGEQERIIAESKIDTLVPTPANGKGRVVLLFDKIKPMVEKTETPPDKGKAPVDKVELTGAPPYRIQLHIEARIPKDFTAIKRDVKLVLREPREYVTSAASFDTTKNRIRVQLAAKELIGPHKVSANLILGPQLKPTKQGVFKQTLTELRQEVDLIADEASFKDSLIEGEVHVKVDGYDRAFSYPVKLSAPGDINPRSSAEVRARLAAPRYAKPNVRFELPLELDGPLADDYRLTVAIDRTGERNRFREEIELFGIRQQKITLGVSPEKHLVCLADVNDWRPAFDTTDVFGDIWFRLRMAKLNPKTKKYERIKPTVLDETQPTFARTEIDAENNVYLRISQGEAPADEYRFIDLPANKEWPTGMALELRVRAPERAPGQAPIAKVVFLRGKAPKDEKEQIKAEDIIAADEDPDPKKTDWTFRLPAQSKAEPLTLSVQFTTRTGTKASITETITFIAPVPPPPALFKIVGKVVYGSLAQHETPVVLTDAKGNEKGAVKTDDKGAFVFEKLSPGIYTITSAQKARNLVGSKKIEIRETDAKELSLTIELLTK